MNRNIPHDAAGPAFYQRDVTFTKIVVDNEVTISHFGGKSQDYTIYFAGKFVWSSRHSAERTKQMEQIRNFQVPRTGHFTTYTALSFEAS